MTMRFWRRRIRSFALTWGVLQFALPFAILFADAQSAAASVGQVKIHIESADTAACQPVHTDECALCRFLSQNNAPTPRETLPVVLASAGFPATDAPRVSCSAAVQRLPDSRAPPRA
jgi:hypothetical protein